jgi:hypothetical protein
LQLGEKSPDSNGEAWRQRVDLFPWYINNRCIVVNSRQKTQSLRGNGFIQRSISNAAFSYVAWHRRPFKQYRTPR